MRAYMYARATIGVPGWLHRVCRDASACARARNASVDAACHVASVALDCVGAGYCGQHGFKWSCSQGGGQRVRNPRIIWGLVDQRSCSGTNTYSALGVCGPWGGTHLNKFTLDYYFRCSI